MPPGLQLRQHVGQPETLGAHPSCELRDRGPAEKRLQIGADGAPLPVQRAGMVVVAVVEPDHAVPEESLAVDGHDDLLDGDLFRRPHQGDPAVGPLEGGHDVLLRQHLEDLGEKVKRDSQLRSDLPDRHVTPAGMQGDIKGGADGVVAALGEDHGRTR